MRAVVVAAAAALLAGCETLSYYAQAIGGHLDVVTAARPIGEWLADPATPAELRSRLEAARAIRAFATASLALPGNGSYTAYAEIGRPYVVWNVYAAPEFSVEPRKECFPFTGCVSYRGFYDEREARRHAEKLRNEGYDVHVGGVPAYSTLGWFDDPLLSTFIRYPESQLARLIFHELAHQVVYARNDTMFNESFAVTVEETGVRRWLEAHGRAKELDAFRAAQARKRAFAARIREARERLDAVYRTELPPEEKRRQKGREFERLRQDYGALIPREPSNAFLLSIALYTELVPAFERLLAEEQGDLPSFYARVKQLARAKHPGEALALR